MAPPPAKSAFGAQSSSSLFGSSRQTPGSSNLFGSSKRASTANGTHHNGQEDSMCEDDSPSTSTADTLYLDPPIYKNSEKGKWKATEGALAAVAPVRAELAAWMAKKDTTQPLPRQRTSVPHNQIYFSSPYALSPPLLSFYRETYTLFTSLQRIVSSAINVPELLVGDIKEGTWGQGAFGPSAETIGHMGRLVGLYLLEMQKLQESQDIEADDRSRYDAAYHIFHLAQILYLPRDGRGEGLLGEELLDWVNDVDPAPDNLQGNEIMQSRPPWDHPSFWPYLSQCILRGFHMPASSFLRTLVDHPHRPISDLASLLSSHLSRFPRSTNVATYQLDHQFLSAHRQWLSAFRAELTASLKGRPKGKWLDEGSDSGKWTTWEKEFRTVVELLEGKPERVWEEAGDWREAMGAWGILVNVNLRRDDLAEVAKRITAKIPIDSSTLDDSIQYALCVADITTWLAAHMGDIFDKLGMILDDEQRFETSIRDYFLLDYIDVLAENPESASLWRVICDYLTTAGLEGRRRLKEHILHVSLDILDPSPPPANEAAKDNEMEIVKDEDELDVRVRKYASIQEACVQLGLPEESRTVSRIMADQLVRRGELGIAATMCLQAEEGNTLARITEQIMETYIRQGEEEYLRLVDSLPPTLLTEAPLALAKLSADPDGPLPLDLPGQTSATVFASRLAFLSEFRDYLLFKMQDSRDRAAGRLVNLLTAGVAPVHFLAVILSESIPFLEDSEILFSANDTFELMRVLEDVELHAAYAQEEYLGTLVRHLMRTSGKEASDTVPAADYDEARRKLEEVRLAMARNLARALVVDFDSPF